VLAFERLDEALEGLQVVVEIPSALKHKAQQLGTAQG
jgi:hypothetical protein